MTDRAFFRHIVQVLCGLCLCLAYTPALAAANHSLEQRDIAFYYGSRPPLDELRHFDQVVIQPSQVLPQERERLLKLDSLVFAYVSIGEVARNSEDIRQINQKWSIGTNPLWNSLVMDMASPAWRDYLLERHFAALWKNGYRAFFLDTVDSYLISSQEGKGRAAQEAGLVALLKEVKDRFPGVQLILNRGFEVLDRLAPYADGMVAESLYSGFDPLTGKHAPTKEENRAWLVNQLKRAQHEFNIPVTVIDYVEPGHWQEAKATAQQIYALGFMPWVANGDLTWLGQGRVRVLPRKILTVNAGTAAGQWQSPAFRFAATPLEYLGYPLEHWYVEERNLPVEPLVGRYAGVLIWLPEDPQGRYGGICARLQREVDAGLPVVFMGTIPQGLACQKLIQYQGSNTATTKSISLVSMHESLGRPSNFPLIASGTVDIRVSDHAQAWLTVKSGEQEFHPIVTAAFGGYALDPHLLIQNSANRNQWLFDPIAFFSKAFRLGEVPVFDFSTENGRRVGLLEIRGDNLFAKNAKGEPVVELLYQWLKNMNTPTTIGIIEGEVTDDLKREAIRRLAALPHVSLANHTYTHPFYWPVFEGKKDANKQFYRYSLYPNDYAADIAREVVGASNFVASFGSKDTPLLMWSGDGQPGPAVLANAKKENINHYGGGGLQWKNGPLSIADLYPSLRHSEWGVQVLTPLVAEPLFARLWYGEALNYSKVTEWNQQLDSPRRLRAHSISINADAFIRPGADALLTDMVVEQSNTSTSLDLASYVKRAQSFQTASIAQSLSGELDVFSDDIRTLRMPKSNKTPLLQAGVIGFSDKNAERYVHLCASHVGYTLVDNAPDLALIEANAPVLRWQRNETGSLEVQFAGKSTLQLLLSKNCTMKINDKRIHAVKIGSGFQYTVIPKLAHEVIHLECG